MQTIIYILAAIILIAIIIIAITGNNNLNRFYKSMDKTFDDAKKESEEYISKLKEINKEKLNKNK